MCDHVKQYKIPKEFMYLSDSEDAKDGKDGKEKVDKHDKREVKGAEDE